MEYNWKMIGERIRFERKNTLHLSQDAFIEKIGISRNTLVDIEHGRRLPHIDTLNVMCKLFQCELGYLLCEYDTKHYITADLQSQTGLSDRAITNIQKLNNMKKPKPLFGENTKQTELDILDTIIADDNFIRLLSVAKDYRKAKLTPNADVNDIANIQAMIAREFLKIIDEPSKTR